MTKFFAPPENISRDSIRITGEDVKHIRNVMRCSPGDMITVCDGNRTDHEARITSLSAQDVTAHIISSKTNENEPPISVTLFQALPKLDKMDFIVQKCVELGVNRIVPVASARCVVKLHSKEDAERKLERWQRISMEAAKQSGRGIIPEVGSPMTFAQVIALADRFDLAIIPYENQDISTRLDTLDLPGNPKKIALIIGPEGGFEPDEAEKAGKAGFKPVRFGPRILRTETAGISIISILMHRFGDM